MRIVFCWLVLVAVASAQIKHADTTGLTDLYLQFDDGASFAASTKVAFTERSDTGVYEITEAQIQSSGLNPGDYFAQVKQGAQANTDPLRGLVSSISWDGDSILPVSGAMDALRSLHLDHLFEQPYDAGSPPGVPTALWNSILERDADQNRFKAKTLEMAPSGQGSTVTAEDVGPTRTWMILANTSGYYAANIIEVGFTSQPTTYKFDMTQALNPGTLINDVTAVIDMGGQLTIGNWRKRTSATEVLFDIEAGMQQGQETEIMVIVTTNDSQTISVVGKLRMQ